MSDTADLIQSLETVQDQFEHYRVSVTPALEDREVGDVSRTLHLLLPDLAFHEGQAAAAGVALGRLSGGADVSAVASTLASALLEHQGARQSNDFLAGFARITATVNRALPR